jgi:hypothetical protein
MIPLAIPVNIGPRPLTLLGRHRMIGLLTLLLIRLSVSEARFHG